jgi:hypothetical protein
MARLITLTGRRWKNFGIGQAEPTPAKAGVGPYALFFDEREILRLPRERDCRDHLERLVQEKWQLDAQVRQMKADFRRRWKLPLYPEDV